MPLIDHVIVLVLENRSFDHMLGYLDHPAPAFDGLNRGGPYSNPGRGGQTVVASAGARAVVPRSPDHSHDGVMHQLGVLRSRGPWNPTNQGFVANFERTCRGRAKHIYAGVLGPLLNFISSRTSASPRLVPDRGSLVMLSHRPEQVPVLSCLALEFAVCTRWFCSVPGETWPNRNFLHAATSDGETDIELRPYVNPTIFELLEKAGKTWRIYHDDTPQVWAFPRLWDTAERHANWYQFEEFATHVTAGDLPNYSFIEPNHRPPLHTLDHDLIIGAPDVSNNQHPENNLVTNAAYDTFDAANTDFARGERLIATVYEALRANPAVFERTLLLVTYDEHGGFYDHVMPPVAVPNPGRDPDFVTWLFGVLLHRRSKAFDFTMLGPRVPAVIVSPFVPRNTIHDVVHDHASVPTTLRALFAPGARPLTRRDAWNTPWHIVATLGKPRGDDLPDLSKYLAPPAAAQSPAAASPASPGEVPPYYTSFVKLAQQVNDHLTKVGEPEAGGPLPATPAEQAVHVSEVFAKAADRHRRLRRA
jgi:phospholipase C